ncbi:MAG: hypothetical protein ACOY93_10840 [Bacillota bacterium]
MGPAYGALAEMLEKVRDRVQREPGRSQPERAALYAEIVNGPALRLLAEGRPEAAETLVEELVRRWIESRR